MKILSKQISKIIFFEMPQCCALKCNNKGVHTFPKEPKRRKKWEDALRIKNFKAKLGDKLCTMHFKEDDYIRESKYTGRIPLIKTLKKNVVPSLFHFTKVPPNNPAAVERQHRLERRSQNKLFNEIEMENITSETSTSKDSAVTELTSTFVEHEEIIITEDAMQSKVEIREPQCSPKSTQIDHEHKYGTIYRYMDDNKAIQFYTGLDLVHKIKYFGNNVINLNAENQFFLTLMKLRQNKCNYELSKFFNVSQTTVSNIFITWINFIYQLWRKINIWPSKDLVQYYMPEHFRNFDSNIRVIIDGTEIPVQKPKNPTSQQASWSSYKHSNTIKVLVGATPGGLLSYCSQAYAGSISDRQAVERSDLITKCESGDSILADRGFTIQDMFADKNVTVKIPTFLKCKSQLPGLTVIKDRELASKRVHIERIIGLTKTYKILKTEIDHNYIPIASKIYFICFMCCNFRECIMKQK